MKRMKKLMSALMALAMVASLGVTALANGDPAPQNNDPAPVTAYANAKGDSTGVGSNEGPMEANPIKIVLPTVADGTYNMILDPHDLIARTSNKKYNGKTFVTNYSDDTKVNNRLFFDDDTANQYSNESKTATVTNKSYDDVNLVVTVEVDPKTNEFEFVKTAADLTSTEDAQMYLAVTDGTSTVAVEAPGDDAEATVGDPTAAVTTAGAEVTATAAFEWLAAATDELKAGVNDAIDGTTITVNATYSSAKYTFALDGSYKDYIMAEADEVAVSGQTDVAVFDIYGTDSLTVVGKVTITFNSANITQDDTIVVTLSEGALKQPVSSATMTVKIEGNSAAYTEDVDSNGNYVWSFDASKEFSSASFQLTGNINGVDAWDDLSASGNQIGVKVIWEVQAYVASESGNNGGQQAADVAPTATVTQTAAAGGTATVTYTLGSGASGKAKVNRVVYTRSGAENAATFTDNNGTLSVTMPAGLIYNQSSAWKVEFTDADGSNPVTVDINPKT
jgi:hypothetical protein